MLSQQIINGLALGSVYCLVALSYSLVMGVLGVLNLAIAALFTLGAYLGYTALERDWPIVAALILAIGGAASASVIVERVAYRPLRSAPLIMPMLSTLGIAILLNEVIINVWGSDPIQASATGLSATYDLGPVQVSSSQLMILLTCTVLVAALAYLLQRTWLGRGLRAVAEDEKIASLLGVPATRITITTFVIAGALAGAGGFLILLNYSTLTASTGLAIGLKGIAVMVVAGTRNVWGALAAGLLLGVCEVLAIAYGGNSYRDVVVWGFLILALMLRPEGLFTFGPRPSLARRA